MRRRQYFNSWAYGLLLVLAIILLVVGLAPIGLLLVARELGLSVSFVDNLGGALFFIFALIVIGILVLPKFPQGTKVAIWIILALGVLNLGGCMALNGLKDIGETKPDEYYQKIFLIGIIM
ncbi:MAG: hypothetical protein ACPG32_02080 [Akkermansiaceae bacterium]